jgi:hypothetical protein
MPSPGLTFLRRPKLTRTFAGNSCATDKATIDDPKRAALRVSTRPCRHCRHNPAEISPSQGFDIRIDDGWLVSQHHSPPEVICATALEALHAIRLSFRPRRIVFRIAPTGDVVVRAMI